MVGLVIILLCSTLGAISGFKNTIIVDPVNGHDTEDCRHNSYLRCATLEYAVKMLANSTQIILHGGTHTVNGTIQIRNCRHIAIYSSYSSATITCPMASIFNTGLEFVRTIDIQISGIKIKSCGFIYPDRVPWFRAAVLVIKSANITINSSAFTNNRGIGLALVEVNGYVSLSDCKFDINMVPKDERLAYGGGSGLYIEHSNRMTACNNSNLHIKNSVYNITGCNFTNNYANAPTQQHKFSSGGGLLIVIKGKSDCNTIVITNSRFENNSARVGGAVQISLYDSVEKNAIRFENVHVTNNQAEIGGGGIATQMHISKSDLTLANKLTFQRTHFRNNSSPTGGGTYVIIGRSKSRHVIISFSQCHWQFNVATIGSALLLAPESSNTLADGYLPVPVFEHCVFENNYIIPFQKARDSTVRQPAVGALFSSTFTINITSRVEFRGNTGTALSITAGSINVQENAVLKFENNTGRLGGALALLEFASLTLSPQSKIIFSNNTATEAGGAIYVYAQDFYASQHCFIRYANASSRMKQWKVHVQFVNNTAGQQSQKCGHGNSIYAMTISNCMKNYIESSRENFSNLFPHKKGDPFSFSEVCKGDNCGISTAPKSLDVRLDTERQPIKLYPGEKRRISAIATDELNHTVSVVVTAVAYPPDVAVIDSTSVNSTDGIVVTVSGQKRGNFSLNFQTNGHRQVPISIILKATFVECPTGFVYALHERKCVCSTEKTETTYAGIIACNPITFNSYQTKSYWAGCNTKGELLTARCPVDYCREDDNTTFNTNILPKTCNELDNVICGVRNRTGILCGECKPNHTVFFHSENYNCHQCKLGRLSWMFYILSEVLPVTLLFLIVTVFNVHLTSGLWNGVILYGQMIDLIQTMQVHNCKLHWMLSALISTYRFIFATFNLDFFKYNDSLSFCLWDGATALDVLVFKYLTTLYTILLLVILILGFKIPYCQDKCQNTFMRSQAILSKSNGKCWVIHGISAFMVLSFTQCMKVSFLILSLTKVSGEGSIPVKHVVSLSGTVEYFSSKHLPFAVLALFVLFTTTLTLILIIVCQNGPRLFTTCFSERYTTKVENYFNAPFLICRPIQIIPITRFKPVFDSFQGCFKDKFRFFSSLFFCYRITIALIVCVISTAGSRILVEIVVLIALALHAWAQPYEQKFHNHLDTFFYINFAIVNALSLYLHTVRNNCDRMYTNLSLAVQVILIYLPIAYIIVMWFLMGLTACSGKARKRLQQLNEYIHFFKPPPDEEDADLGSSDAQETVPYRMYRDCV